MGIAETMSSRQDPVAPQHGGLSKIQREAEQQMSRTRLTMWLTLGLGLVMGSALITWAILGPRLDVRAQAIMGLLVALEVIAMGMLLAIYARTHVKAMERHLERLHSLAVQLEDASVRDSLTGLYNHGYLLSRLQEEISLAERHQRSLSVIILDLNEFKEVNDRHGHLVGDEVLRMIATTIREQVRQHDIVARYGGDEFCIVLPATDQAGAQGMVENLRAAVAVLSERLEGWTGGHISFGCGIATYPDDGATTHSLIAAADAQLYQEKQVDRLARAQEGEAQAQNLFHRIGEAIAQALDPTERLNRLAETICTSLNLRNATILWHEEGELRAVADYYADRELAAAIRETHAKTPLTGEETPGSLAVQRNEVITLERMTTQEGVPERFASILPPGLWSQWTPISLEGQPPAVLLLMGMAGEASPPEPGLARALGRLLGGAIQNSLNYEDARRQRDQLAALADVGALLLKSGPFEERLGQVAQRVGEAIGFDAITILTDDPQGGEAILTSTYARENQHLVDEWEGNLKQQPSHFAKILRKSFTLLREPIVIEKPAEHPLVPPFLQEICRRGGIHSLLVLPLRIEDQAVGALSVISTRQEAFDPETVSLFRAIAGQIASSTQVALLLRQVQDSYQELRQSHLDAMMRLAAIAEARDPFTGSHLHRLRSYTEAIASRMGLNEADVTELGLAAIVHDIGKLRVPDGILNKPGSLTEEEWAFIRKHPIYGEELLGKNSFYELARQVARWHHERWDGSGYPDGIKAEAIPPCVRIVSVADVLDALTSRRPYKEAWPIEDAIDYIREQRGKHFAPEVVDAFLTLAQDGSLESLMHAMHEGDPELSAMDERLVA